MKKERKEALIGCFPPVSDVQHQQMKGKGAANFIVFLTWGRELFARGFHRYSNGELVERQRYVFAKAGAVRYGRETGTRWTVRSEFRERPAKPEQRRGEAETGRQRFSGQTR